MRMAECHPEKRHHALGLCQTCYGRQSRPKYPESLYVNSRRKTNLKRRYGITVEEYDALLESQEGRCKVCRRLPQKMRLQVDHDHEIEKKLGKVVVRGLLCFRCNRGLGAFEYLNENLARARDYMQAIIDLRQNHLVSGKGTH